MAELVGILGSVTPPGRMHKALAWLLDAARAAEPKLETELINLADYRISFSDGRPPDQYGDDTGPVVAKVAHAQAVVLASPVYRGTYTGALKNLLDQLPIEALMGKPCGIFAMGATPHHYLGVEWHLRDVLTWFGAIVAPSGVYLSSSDFVQGEPSDSAREDLGALARSILALRTVASDPDRIVGPLPLAARKR